jgi:hypothetical protein
MPKGGYHVSFTFTHIYRIKQQLGKQFLFKKYGFIFRLFMLTDKISNIGELEKFFFWWGGGYLLHILFHTIIKPLQSLRTMKPAYSRILQEMNISITVSNRYLFIIPVSMYLYINIQHNTYTMYL